MKTEDQAWHDLQQHAAAQLRPGFADRVIRRAHGPSPATWQQLQEEGAGQLRAGFAIRVLNAARSLPALPSLFDQLALSAVTATVCLLGTIAFYEGSARIEESRNLAQWQQFAAEVQQVDFAE